MPAALVIRDDISAEELRRTARLEANGRVACRLLAIANALDGMSRERAAEQAGIDRQSLRDWVVRYNAEGMPTHRRTRPHQITHKCRLANIGQNLVGTVLQVVKIFPVRY